MSDPNIIYSQQQQQQVVHADEHQQHASAPANGQSTTHSAATTELSSLTLRLRAALRQYPDFPSPGILFEDILPIFADPSLSDALLRSLQIHLTTTFPLPHPAPGSRVVDVVVGLEARGFLFGPGLALRLGAAFVPVRKKGKLPGPVERVSYQKEYGEDVFEMQAGAIKPGQRVVVVDDIIATGELEPRMFGR